MTFCSNPVPPSKTRPLHWPDPVFATEVKVMGWVGVPGATSRPSTFSSVSEGNMAMTPGSRVSVTVGGTINYRSPTDD